MLSSTKEPAHCHFGAAETVVLALESVADGVSQIDGEKMWIDDRLGSKRSVAGRKEQQGGCQRVPPSSQSDGDANGAPEDPVSSLGLLQLRCLLRALGLPTAGLRPDLERRVGEARSSGLLHRFLEEENAMQVPAMVPSGPPQRALQERQTKIVQRLVRSLIFERSSPAAKTCTTTSSSSSRVGGHNNSDTDSVNKNDLVCKGARRNKPQEDGSQASAMTSSTAALVPSSPPAATESALRLEPRLEHDSGRRPWAAVSDSASPPDAIPRPPSLAAVTIAPAPNATAVAPPSSSSSLSPKAPSCRADAAKAALSPSPTTTPVYSPSATKEATKPITTEPAESAAATTTSPVVDKPSKYRGVAAAAAVEAMSSPSAKPWMGSRGRTAAAVTTKTDESLPSRSSTKAHASLTIATEDSTVTAATPRSAVSPKAKISPKTAALAKLFSGGGGGGGGGGSGVVNSNKNKGSDWRVKGKPSAPLSPAGSPTSSTVLTKLVSPPVSPALSTAATAPPTPLLEKGSLSPSRFSPTASSSCARIAPTSAVAVASARKEIVSSPAPAVPAPVLDKAVTASEVSSASSGETFASGSNSECPQSTGRVASIIKLWQKGGSRPAMGESSSLTPSSGSKQTGPRLVSPSGSSASPVSFAPASTLGAADNKAGGSVQEQGPTVEAKTKVAITGGGGGSPVSCKSYAATASPSKRPTAGAGALCVKNKSDSPATRATSAETSVSSAAVDTPPAKPAAAVVASNQSVLASPAATGVETAGTRLGAAPPAKAQAKAPAAPTTPPRPPRPAPALPARPLPSSSPVKSVAAASFVDCTTTVTSSPPQQLSLSTSSSSSSSSSSSTSSSSSSPSQSSSTSSTNPLLPNTGAGREASDCSPGASTGTSPTASTSSACPERSPETVTAAKPPTGTTKAGLATTSVEGGTFESSRAAPKRTTPGTAKGGVGMARSGAMNAVAASKLPSPDDFSDRDSFESGLSGDGYFYSDDEEDEGAEEHFGASQFRAVGAGVETPSNLNPVKPASPIKPTYPSQTNLSPVKFASPIKPAHSGYHLQSAAVKALKPTAGPSEANTPLASTSTSAPGAVGETGIPSKKMVKAKEIQVFYDDETEEGMGDLGNQAAAWSDNNEATDEYFMTDDEDSDNEDDDPALLKLESTVVPEWATEASVAKALERQYGGDKPINPNKIFVDFYTCSLENIFDTKKKKWDRKSTGDWMSDRLTIAEKLAYDRAMGYVTINTSGNGGVGGRGSRDSRGSRGGSTRRRRDSSWLNTTPCDSPLIE